jgi:hypothetical protein
MTPDTMRVVLHSRNDTIEYHRISNRWAGDDGSRVSIDAMLPTAAVQPVGARGLTLAAGS